MDWLEDDIESTMDEPDFVENVADAVAKHVSEEAYDKLKMVAQMWMQMGIGKTRREQRIAEVFELLTTVIGNIYEGEKKHLEEVIEYRDKKLKEINEFLSDLSLNPYVIPDDVSLMQLAKLMHIKYEELKAIRDERMNMMTELKSTRAKLCLALGIQPKSFTMATNIPSEDELIQLQSYISDLAKEKSKRSAKYQTLRKMIQSLFTETEREPYDDFEKELLFGDVNQFILSDENIRRLQALHAELEAEYSRNNEQRKTFESRLVNLWNRLEVTQTERDLFLAENCGCKPSVLKSLAVEIDKYEELKRQNIGIFIGKIRPELDEWYEKCCCSDDDRESFKPFLEDDDFSEELLEVHEKELEKWQQFYTENESVFTKLNRWKELWLKLHELESKMSDPSRFNNRGGALLMEEKERKQLHKGLPKLQKDLQALGKEWSDRNGGKKFKVYGIELDKYFDDCWNDYQQAKENEKMQRQRQKQIDLQANARKESTRRWWWWRWISIEENTS